MSAFISSIVRHVHVNHLLHFRFRFHPQFVCRHFSVYSSSSPSSISNNRYRRRNDVVDDPHLFLQNVRDQCKLGFCNVDIPVKLFHQLYSLHPLPCVILFNQLFTAMSKIKAHPPFSTILTLSNQLELSGLRPNSYSVSIVANCYCRLGRVDFGFSLLGKLIKLGYPPHIVIVTTLLNGLIASDKLYPAVKMLDKVVKLGIQPTVFTHGAMFKGLCRVGDNTGALKLLRDMERKSPFKPNVIIYNTLIDSHCKDRLLPQALDLFEEMKGKGILPDVVTYTSLIRWLCSLGQWDDAKALWTEMLDSDIAPTVNTYNTWIDMYCKEGNVNEARAFFKSMVKNGTMPNVVTFNSLLNGYCKAKQIDKAVGMFEDMCIKGTYASPDVFTYSTLIDALCKDNRLQLALLLFENMKHRGIVSNVVTYSTLLDGLLKHAQFDRAISMRWEMENNGVAPNHFTCSIIINGLYEVGRLTEAIEMFSHLVARGLRPSVTTYNIIIKVLCRPGLLGDATALLKKMEENECTPNECTYNTIIKGFLNANDVVKALEYFDMMRSQGFAAEYKVVCLFLDVLIDRNASYKDKALLQKYFF